ncbi:MAG: HAMP domain-containing histidine kinase, partial [Oscillospiraceae bacterium]|nr:HAMP domain-containing histidine kinase [Oscillospiraceae bacterium]
PEYEQALASKTRQAEYTGRNEFGEKIMAMTFLLPASETENTGAIRYMISLQSVDKQVGIMLVASFLVLVIVITLVTISGVYFTQSIVNPVRKINETAKQIAKGDLNARIESNQYNDEIGELCETINYMASEIGQSDRMRNDFISTVSHEMKTPLTAIKGWGETLLQMGDTDPSLTQKGLDVIIDEAARLTGVVEDLLDLSKIVNGNMSLRKEKIDVLAELDDAVYVFKDRSMREGIDLMYNVPDAPAPMEADGNRIKQVFVNILDNAFKYTEQGGKISIYAEVRTQETMDPDMCELCIYVEDTGRGISPEDLPRIKEKFYKSNISIRGSGIGLAVCDEIMKLHDGTLDIKSQLGQGALVTLVFPVEKIIFNVETSAPAEERGTENE